jgi:hypothetical protein
MPAVHAIFGQLFPDSKSLVGPRRQTRQGANHGAP